MDPSSEEGKNISWHLRYNEYSFLFYVSFCVLVVLFYVLLYCLRVPINRVPNLESILDADPVITGSMMEKLGLAPSSSSKKKKGRHQHHGPRVPSPRDQDCSTSPSQQEHQRKSSIQSEDGAGGKSRRSSAAFLFNHFHSDGGAKNNNSAAAIAAAAATTPEALGARFRFIGALNRQWKSPEEEDKNGTLSALLEEEEMEQ